MKDIDFVYKESLFGKDAIFGLSEEVLPYIKHLQSISKFEDVEKHNFLYKENESSINLPFDNNILKSVNDCVTAVGVDELKYIIVVGIGGSNLGTKAIYDGIRGNLDSFLRNRVPKIIFLDTVDEIFLGDLQQVLRREIKNKKEILVNIISKSGATTETITNFEVLNLFLQDIIGDTDNRIVVTTDKGSKLWSVATKAGLKTLDIPKKVGGRYSVFSSVGLFPLVACGFDIRSLLSGARTMRDICTKDNLEKNPAFISAVLIYLHNKDGINIHNSFFFNPELESLGKWYRQLMGESIGKKFGIDGVEINAGITPIVSIGSADLHSMAQLYFGGPMDKFTTFVYSQNKDKTITIPKILAFDGLVDGIKNKNISSVSGAIFDSVKMSYRRHKLPFMEVRLSCLDEYSLGQFLQFKMIEMMYLAHLLGVDAFNQPNVEDYKNETRKILLS